jgi:hypothetical protein
MTSNLFLWQYPSSYNLTYDLPQLIPPKDRCDFHTNKQNLGNARSLGSASITHHPVHSLIDFLAYSLNRIIKFTFDLLSGVLFGQFFFHSSPELRAIKRIVFLESIAGVPGATGYFLRHVRSTLLHLPDYGRIEQLFSEAENERMHLFIALQVHQPRIFMRMALLVVYLAFNSFYFLTYLIVPSFCHRLSGYMEEDAVHTYTQMLQDLDNGKFPGWKELKAPKLARIYYKLPENALWRDVLLNIRQDEIHHRDSQHSIANHLHLA